MPGHARGPDPRVRRARGARAGRGPSAARARRRPGADQGVARRGSTSPTPTRARTPTSPRYELPLVPGAEVAGEVDGQRVVARARHRRLRRVRGRAARQSSSRCPTACPTPRRSAIVVQGLSAWHLLKTSSHMAEGESVVVHAAAGGVGSLAVQLAKRYGAGRVIATASTEEKRALALELGADAAVDPNTEDLEGARCARPTAAPRSTSCSRWPAAASSTQSLRRARAVRPARHLRPGLARAERGLQRRADGPQPGRRRLLARALLQPPAGDDRRAAAGAVRAGGLRRPARGRGRGRTGCPRRGARTRTCRPADERQARARSVAERGQRRRVGARRPPGAHGRLERGSALGRLRAPAGGSLPPPAVIPARPTARAPGSARTPPPARGRPPSGTGRRARAPRRSGAPPPGRSRQVAGAPERPRH